MKANEQSRRQRQSGRIPAHKKWSGLTSGHRAEVPRLGRRVGREEERLPEAVDDQVVSQELQVESITRLVAVAEVPVLVLDLLGGVGSGVLACVCFQFGECCMRCSLDGPLALLSGSRSPVHKEAELFSGRADPTS